jgi:glycosyltransferase involved in cell wall biosynthesis
VDVRSNAPDVDGAPFRAALAIEPDVLLVVVVCRLARELKLEGLLAACRTIGQLASEGVPVRLLLVGDGPVRAQVEEEAARANALAGARAVVLAGELQDPRPAYASADIMLGMGGSALRGMAFGKPLIVQGERGFWQLCDEDSVGQFLDGGWYGLGDGGDGSSRLRAQLLPLLTDPERRAQLGRFSRALVVDRFSLDHAARTQLEVYDRAAKESERPAPTEVARTLAMLGSYKLQRRWERLRGLAPADDFNAIQQMQPQGRSE